MSRMARLCGRPTSLAPQGGIIGMVTRRTQLALGVLGVGVRGTVCRRVVLLLEGTTNCAHASLAATAITRLAIW